MKIILTKHGETIENKKGIIQGHLQGKLSKLGKEQAKKIALKLRNERIDYIYSSDLARAKDTAKEIAKYHLNVPLILTKELREKKWGEFEGKTKEQLGFPKDKPLNKNIKVKNSESIKQVYDRANRFIKELLKNHKNQTILLIGHGTIDKAIICCIFNKSFKTIEYIKEIKPTSITIIKYEKNPKLKLFNSTEHLK
jgi:broad specificity phosphatase PhoE